MAKTMMLYEKIVPLDTTKHRDMLFTPVRDYSFAAASNAFPLAGTEFPEASKFFPIAFVKDDQGGMVPYAIVGLQNDQNLFVDKEGRWAASYIPAFVRRYPFVPSNTPDGRFHICFDETYSGFHQEGGEALFIDDNVPAPEFQNILNLLQDYHVKMEATLDFCRRLSENNLLTEMNAEIQAPSLGGKALRLNGLHAIDEQRLAELDREKVLDFFARGELAWMYSQLSSVSNFRRLAEKLEEGNS